MHSLQITFSDAVKLKFCNKEDSILVRYLRTKSQINTITSRHYSKPSYGTLSCHLHGVARPPSNEQVAKSTSPPAREKQSIVITRASAISGHSSVGVSGPEIHCILVIYVLGYDLGTICNYLNFY